MAWCVVTGLLCWKIYMKTRPHASYKIVFFPQWNKFFLFNKNSQCYWWNTSGWDKNPLNLVNYFRAYLKTMFRKQDRWYFVNFFRRWLNTNGVRQEKKAQMYITVTLRAWFLRIYAGRRIMLITWSIVSRKITQGRVFSRYAWNLACEIISIIICMCALVFLGIVWNAGHKKYS